MLSRATTNVNSAQQPVRNAELPEKDGSLAISGWVQQSRPGASKLPEQPPAAIDYGEANRQANQEYDWTSEKEFLYHDNRTLA